MAGESELISAHPASQDYGNSPYSVKQEPEGSTHSVAFHEDIGNARDTPRKTKSSKKTSSQKTGNAEADSTHVTPKSAMKKASRRARKDQSIMGVSIDLACPFVQPANILDRPMTRASCQSDQ